MEASSAHSPAGPWPRWPPCTRELCRNTATARLCEAAPRTTPERGRGCCTLASATTRLHAASCPCQPAPTQNPSLEGPSELLSEGGGVLGALRGQESRQGAGPPTTRLSRVLDIRAGEARVHWLPGPLRGHPEAGERSWCKAGRWHSGEGTRQHPTRSPQDLPGSLLNTLGSHPGRY